MLATTQIDALSDIVHYLNFHEFHQASHRNAQTHPLYVSGGSVQASYFNYTISSRFQPIRNIRSGKIDAHEAFLVVNPLHGDHRPLSPLSAFQLHFDQAGITYIDRLARTVNTLNFLAEGGGTHLHLNVHPLHLAAVQQDHGRVFEVILPMRKHKALRLLRRALRRLNSWKPSVSPGLPACRVFCWASRRSASRTMIQANQTEIGAISDGKTSVRDADTFLH